MSALVLAARSLKFGNVVWSMASHRPMPALYRPPFHEPAQAPARVLGKVIAVNAASGISKPATLGTRLRFNCREATVAGPGSEIGDEGPPYLFCFSMKAAKASIYCCSTFCINSLV